MTLLTGDKLFEVQYQVSRENQPIITLVESVITNVFKVSYDYDSLNGSEGYVLKLKVNKYLNQTELQEVIGFTNSFFFSSKEFAMFFIQLLIKFKKEDLQQKIQLKQEFLAKLKLPVDSFIEQLDFKNGLSAATIPQNLKSLNSLSQKNVLRFLNKGLQGTVAGLVVQFGNNEYKQDLSVSLATASIPRAIVETQVHPYYKDKTEVDLYFFSVNSPRAVDEITFFMNSNLIASRKDRGYEEYIQFLTYEDIKEHGLSFLLSPFQKALTSYIEESLLRLQEIVSFLETDMISQNLIILNQRTSLSERSLQLN